MDEPYSFDDLTVPVCDAIRELYDLKPRGDYGDKVEWTGPDLGKSLRANSLTFDVALTRDSLEYNNENQGRSPLQTVVGIAIQLGIEQGRRLYRKDQEMSLKLLDMAVKLLKNDDDIIIEG